MSLRIPIRIALEALNTQVVERFEKALRVHPVIDECYAVAGDSDYLIFVTTSSFEEFERIHRDILSRLPGVRKIKADVPLRRIM